MILRRKGKRFIWGWLFFSVMTAAIFLPLSAGAQPVIKIGAIGPMKFEPGKNVANGVALAALPGNDHQGKPPGRRLSVPG